jgi:hypothetical protein
MPSPEHHYYVADWQCSSWDYNLTSSIEYVQGEAKRELDNLLWEFENPDTFPFAAGQAVHNLNHKPRTVSDGEWSCFQWQMHVDVHFTRTYRRLI